MLVDLHAHSRHTEGCSIDPLAAIQQAESSGLDGICFTDLDTLSGLEEIHGLRERTSIAVFAGLEVSTDHGKLLCFFPEPGKVPDLEEFLGPREEKGWSTAAVISKVQELKGAVVVPHPYDSKQESPMGDFIFTLERISAVEGIAGNQSANVNELAIQAAEHLSLPCVGGSGALESVEEIGTAATLFRDEVRDEAGLVDALLDGHVWAVAIGTPLRFHGDKLAARAREDRRRPRRGRR